LAGRDETIRDKLVSISIYPSIVLAIAAIVIYQLAAGPLPQVGRVLESLKGGLPWQSELIIGIGKFIGAYPIAYLVFIASLLSSLTCLPSLIRRTPVLHKWILKIPLLGKLALASIRANFVQSLLR
jgi:type II secretory pathway component PulF